MWQGCLLLLLVLKKLLLFCYAMFGRCSIRAATRLCRRPVGTVRAANLPRAHRCGFASVSLDGDAANYYCLGVNVGAQLNNGTLNDLTPSDVEAICAGLADVLNEAEMRCVCVYLSGAALQELALSLSPAVSRCLG